MKNQIIENNADKNKTKINFNYFKCLKCAKYITLNINPHNFSASYECDNGDIEEDIYFGSINQFTIVKHAFLIFNIFCDIIPF